MNDGSPPGSHPSPACVPVEMNMFEERKAETNNPVASFPRGCHWRRMNGTKHVPDAAHKQLVLVAKMHIKGGTANVGAIQDLLYRDFVVRLFLDQAAKASCRSFLVFSIRRSLTCLSCNVTFTSRIVGYEQDLSDCPVSHMSTLVVLQVTFLQPYNREHISIFIRMSEK
jgi:hypothetical protein